MDRHKLLVILDSARFDTFVAANTPNIDKLRSCKYNQAYAPGVFTIPSLLTYLMNYPPISLRNCPLFPGFPADVWLPKVFKDRNYTTAIYTGHPWIPMLTRITEGFFIQYFDIFRLGYYKEEVFKIVNDMIEDFKKASTPVFSVTLFYNTHAPFRCKRFPGKLKNVQDLRYDEALDGQKIEIERVDTALGELFKTLRTLDRSSDIIVTADHADIFGGPVGYIGHNPMHLKKFNIELIQIPYVYGEIRTG